MESALLGGPVRWKWSWASPVLARRARPIRLKCENEYLVLALEEETAVQAIVDSTVGRFAGAKSQKVER